MLAPPILTLERFCCAVIEYVSASGARVRGSINAAPGDDLWLKVGCLDQLAKVEWCDGDLCGITFDPPLDNENVIHLRCEARNTLVMRLERQEAAVAKDWIRGLAR